MTKDIIFIVAEEGSFERGFSLTLQIRENSRPIINEMTVQLSPNPDLFSLQNQLRQNYQNWGIGHRWWRGQRIVAVEGQITHVASYQDCLNVADDLRKQFNQWLNQPALRQLERLILSHVNRQESARFILKTSHLGLQRLPWHLWDFIEESYPDAEVIIGTNVAPSSEPLPYPVKILVILGGDEQIDLDKDREIISQLPHTQVTILYQPERHQLTEKLLEQAWDILFFAGHSSTDDLSEIGSIYLNTHDILTPNQFDQILRKAVRNGLKLAIFNSCDGLGLAKGLASLKTPVPHIIVMREPIHDQVAQLFLKHFLKLFSQGRSLEEALANTRHYLTSMERNSPCVSWLPILLQNPETPPLKFPLIPDSIPIPTILDRIRQQRSLLVILLLAIIGLGSGLLWKFLNPPNPLEHRLSIGEEVLVTAQNNTAKIQGTKAFKKQDYQSAIAYFSQSLKQEKNDPETVIYLNNVRALMQRNYNRIGVSVPIGSNKEIAAEILRGVATFQDKLNTQINTQKMNKDRRSLVIEIANDDNNSAIAQEIAQYFVKETAIQAVIGHNASDASVAAAPIYQKGGLVMLSPTSFSDRLISLGDRIFRMVPLSSLTDKLANYIVKTTPKAEVTICFDEQAIDNASFATRVASKLIDENISYINIPCNFSDPQFNADQKINEIISQGIDTLILAPHVDRIEKALEMAKVNQGRLTLFGSSTLFTGLTLTEGQAVNGLALIVPWYEDQSDAFSQELAKKWGITRNWRTILSYDATVAIAEALSVNPTRKGIAQVLRRQDFRAKGVSGDIQFLPSGDRVPNLGANDLVQVQYAEESGYQFVPISLPP
ncbi:MAG: ABC transporter substrate-binding protein [Synechocystis sp.]